MENMAARFTEEELLRDLDDIVDVIPEQVKRPGKRSSILKQPKNTEELCLTEDLNKRKSYSKRRVSFAEKFQVMELCTGNIYDVPGKSVSSSDSAINPDISSEAKPEVEEKSINQISMNQVFSSSKDIELNYEEYSLTNTSRKHKIDSVDVAEPERKKLHVLERSSTRNSTMSFQNMVADFDNCMLKYLQDDQETMVNQNMDCTFTQSVNANVDVKKSLNFNKIEDTIPINKFQDVLNVPKSRINAENNCLPKSFVSNNVFSVESSNITSNLGDQCVYDTISKQVPNVQLFPVSLSSIPLVENKENIYVDAKNKKVLVTSGRHLKLREIPPVSDAHSLKSSFEIAPLDLKDTNTHVSINSALQHFMSSNSPVKQQVLNKSEKTKFDKTNLFNQSMNLTCIVPEFDKFHDSESSIQNDFLKADTISSSEGNFKITAEKLNNLPSNTFPGTKFKTPNECLNKTKFSICDMDLTTCAGIGPFDNPSVEGRSFAKYDPSSDISCDSRRPDPRSTLPEIVSSNIFTDMLTKLESGPILYSSAKSLISKKFDNIPAGKENFISSRDILCGKLQNSAEVPSEQKEKSEFDKTVLFNQSMDLSDILPRDTKQSDSDYMLPEITSKENLSNDILTKLDFRPFLYSATKSVMSKKLNNFPNRKENFVSSSDILYGKSQNSADAPSKQKERFEFDKTILFNQSMDLSGIIPIDTIQSDSNSMLATVVSKENFSNDILAKFECGPILYSSTKTSMPKECSNILTGKEKSVSSSDILYAKSQNSTQVQVLKQREKSILDKTSLFNQSMDLTCIVPESDKLNNSESSVQEGFLNVKCRDFLNAIPALQFKQPAVELNKTKVNTYDMECTCAGDSHTSENDSIENDSFVKYKPASKISSDIKHQSVPSSGFSETDLQEDHSFSKMTGSSKSILMQDEKAVYLNPSTESELGEMHMELTCHDKVFNDFLIFPKDSIYDAKTKNFTSDAMELTCFRKNDSELEKSFEGKRNASTKISEDTSKRKSDDKDYKLHNISLDFQKKNFVSAEEDIDVTFKKRGIENAGELQNCTVMFKKGVCASSTKIFDNANEHFSDLQTDPNLKHEMEMASININTSMKPHNFILSQTAVTQENASDNRFGKFSNESCAVDEIRLPSRSLSEVLFDKNVLKSELSRRSLSTVNTINDKATRCFTSDLMELTSRSKWGKSQVLDQTNKNTTSMQVGEKTKYFCSDVMELTPTVKNLSNTHSLKYDNAALKLLHEDKMKPTNYVKILTPLEFSNAKNSGANNFISHLQLDADSVPVPEIKLTKLSVLETSSVSCNIGCSSCSDIIHKQQTVSEINVPSSIKSSSSANNEERDEQNNAAIHSSASKKMYETAKSGIVYAIKKLKSMNHLSDTDDDILKFPEVFLSLKKQQKPVTSFSCTKIKLSSAVRNAFRQSCSFNYDGQEISFTAEMDVRQTSTTDKYQRLSRNKESVVSESSVTDAASVFLPEYSENIEHFVKNDTDIISNKKFELHNSFTEENIELISDSILNDISITKNDTNSVSYKNLDFDNFQKENNSSLKHKKMSQKESARNENNYNRLNTPAKLNLEISMGVITTPENIHKTIVLPAEKLYDDHTLDEVSLKGMINQTRDINKDVWDIKTPILGTPTIQKSVLGSSKAKLVNPIHDILITPSAQIAFNTTEVSDSAKSSFILPTVPGEDSAMTALVTPDIDKLLLDSSKAKSVNPINGIPISDEPTPSVQNAFDTTERPDSVKCTATLSTISRKDSTAKDDPRLINSCDISDEVHQKINLWRRTFFEASQDKDCPWSLEEMDNNHAVFELMGNNLFGVYSMRVPLQLNPQNLSGTEILFQHIRDPDEIEELGYFLLMNHLSGHTEISPFSAEELLAKFPIYVDAAMKAESLMKDITLATIRSELSVDYSQNVPRLKLIILKRVPFSIFSLTFAINVKTYPNEEIIPEVEHLEWDKIEKETILGALKKIKPGKNYIHRMIDAVRAF